jgi:predicted TIM-barrel fold metal-dependent hydrolase
MNAPVLERETKAAQKAGVVDCDVHVTQRAPSVLYPYLARRWREHLETFGGHVRQGVSGIAFPRMMGAGQRLDAYPENGGPPGSDLALTQRQLLDAHGIETGMMVALGRGGMEERNQDYAQALSHALNEWQIEDWVKPEPRLKAGIVVPQEDAEFCAREIAERAENPDFRQVIISPRSAEPLGRKRYWPIFAAAEAAGLPIGLHPAAVSGGAPSTGTGWPTYYMQEHYSFESGLQGTVTSLIFEGVFERFPKLRVVLIEGGFTWAPALAWRMDRAWERMRAEVPQLKRPPSEYLREHVWFTTQPIEEPETPDHLAEMIDWLGWDRLMFSTDYPHWDFDDPRFVFKIKLTDEQKAKVFRDNARAFYRL